MFSATWPQIIQKLASEFLSSPIKVAIGSQDLQACKRVKQIVEGTLVLCNGMPVTYDESEF